MSPDNRDQIAEAIALATGRTFQPTGAEPVGGGCINAAVRLSDGERNFFVKTNQPSLTDMFEAELEGLRAMMVPRAPRVPAPVTAGATGTIAFLVLEYVPMRRPSGRAWAILGEQLAALHRATAPDFGWHRDNTIGSTPQVNDWIPGWVEFWRQRRLGPQLELAERNGLDRAVAGRGRELLSRFDRLFVSYRPQPSLLHGDLWSGNVAADQEGRPVLFDPAVYYGDREADLAMSELFGRFDRRFYDAYEAAWPLDRGYGDRRTLYNLYHILNHFNLFGAGYASQAQSMIDRLLAALE
jgi:protein-ribulosamine 3-kinase